jgi:two-component system cell cycle sensor histidine kinase/response regulator CckA
MNTVAARPNRRGHALRWRLPVLVSGLIALVVTTFLWAAYRQIEGTLLRTGGGRALAAAEQMAALLARSTQQRFDEVGRAAADAAVQECLEAPTDATRQPARERLALLSASGQQVVDLWNERGELVLRVTSPTTTSRIPLIRTAPSGTGLSPIQIAGGAAFYDVVADVQRPRSPETDRPILLGRVVARRLLSSATTRDLFNSLVGGGAAISVGNRTGGVWSDLVTQVPAPPVAVTEGAPVAFQGTAGDPRVASGVRIHRTPWAVWVEFPRAAILEPARAFLLRMFVIALAVMVMAAVLAYTLTTRITTPLSALTQAAEAIASGDYSRRVAVDRRDEIGRLGDAFNTMTGEVARELTARTIAEHALRDREASFRALFADNPLPMWLYDLGTLEFLEVNDAALRHYGYTRDEFLGMRITDIRPADEVPRLLANLESAGHSWDQAGTWRHRLRSGQIIDVDITAHALTFEGRSAELVVAQDISERTRLETQLRQAHKMEAVGRLAGGVAHDFNNLLTAILGYSNLILEQSEVTPSALRADVEEIQKAGESAASLTRQLLAFSRKQILQPQILDLNAVVGRIDALLQRLIGEDIELVTHLPGSIDRVHADPGQIEQIIMNLAVNARDAMPQGGKLTIETGNVELDARYAAAHPGASVGRHVMLAVSDTGTGMDDETQSHVFEPFFTTKHNEGTGLGLATVYGIVKQSGGSIWVYSEVGRGTTFKMYLPHATQPSAQAIIGVTPPAQGGTETILLAEDQPEVRAVTRAILSRRGYTVLVASGGEEALHLVREFQQPIHLLLTDVVMPSMSGRELFTHVHALRPEVRVLYASGYTDNAVVYHGVLEQGVAFIQKPFTPERLLGKVRDVLDKPMPMTAA